MLGFAVYSLLSQRNGTALTHSVTFSTLTLFSLLEQPVNTLVKGGEQLIAVLKGFQRIQEYLTLDEKPVRQLTTQNDSEYEHAEGKREFIPPDSIIHGHVDIEQTFPGKFAVLRNVSGRFPEMKIPSLQNLSLEIDEGRITMVTGQIGCGKSLFLQLLLHEIPYFGSMWTSASQAAYCGQTAWLFSETIRDNIPGSYEWDKPWYYEVLRACALDVDGQNMPKGHYTQVGVRGFRISGGQQMLISLARALYSKQKVLILDNVMTGIDQRTLQHMLHSLFSSSGLLRRNKHTVVLATTFGMIKPPLHYADSVILLGHQGPTTLYAALEGSHWPLRPESPDGSAAMPLKQSSQKSALGSPNHLTRLTFITMVRLSSLLALVGLLGAPLVAAAYNETEQNENATCDNGCFFSSFNGSCANDAACMCDQQKYREAYFCCMGKKCASSVLPDSIVRQQADCDARNMPFTFDALAVCGITLTTSTTSSTTATSAGATASTASTASTTSSAGSSTGTSAASSTNASGSSATASKTSTASSTSTPTGNSASANTVMLNAVVGIFAASVMLS
ncbi:Cyclic peptide transporter [Penicillium cataractarum]|uniref:Cyclic peptide transporter n=1 Tax=Penicillium cataractarum TaxID=2100454 RepID=A0A9W9SH78_9EURO|nr:Cyclic peptide transporter [Penicillium cataractarum]KAJ5377955.1 Cyclic peptide transporter [Penicillium cataractarum]